MDKTRLGLMGAISSLVALPVSAGAAAPQDAVVPPAQSFSELLQPIPNAAEKLKVSDAQELAHARGVQLIQAQWHHHHHHHHHHAHYYRPWRRSYWGYSYAVPYYGYARPYYGGRYHHHHHHHHHWR